MHAPNFPKLLLPTAAGLAAFGVAAPAQAKVAAPQKHPEIIGILKHQIGTPKKHPEIIAILAHGQVVINMRKAGGDKEL